MNAKQTQPDKATAKFFWYRGGNHIALVEDGKRTLLTLPNGGSHVTTPADLKEIADKLNEHAALEAVAAAAEELRQEQTSLDMCGDRATEKERVEARHFYENTVAAAEAKLDEALSNLDAVKKGAI